MSIEKHTEPEHYKGFVDDYEWADVMSRLPGYRANPEKFKGALEFTLRKYIDRNGRKDKELQELKKARFYLCYLIHYIENDCQPIMARDVHKAIAAFESSFTSS